MAKAKNSYINADLDSAEAKLREWKLYIDANPINKLKDRFEGKRLIATIETQGKYIQETLKNYLALLEVVNKLREQEEQKQMKVRGSDDLTPFERGEI